jgi:hypothetical protein
MNLTARNPKKIDMLHMTTLLYRLPPQTNTILRYTILDGADIIRTDRVTGLSPNIKILTELSSTNYGDMDLRVTDLLTGPRKPLQ